MLCDSDYWYFYVLKKTTVIIEFGITNLLRTKEVLQKLVYKVLKNSSPN